MISRNSLTLYKTSTPLSPPRGVYIQQFNVFSEGVLTMVFEVITTMHFRDLYSKPPKTHPQIPTQFSKVRRTNRGVSNV